MKSRRIVSVTNENGTVNVIDDLTGETIATFSYEWRAAKYADELAKEYARKGEPILVDKH